MIWSAQTIKFRVEVEIGSKRLGIDPFSPTKSIEAGMSYGLTAAGYDIRLGRPAGLTSHLEDGIFIELGSFVLAHSHEFVSIPIDCQAIVHDKSSLARRGLSLFNTVLEPGWFGYITLELANHSLRTITIPYFAPIAQIVFHQLDEPTTLPYKGKYQNQPNHPVRSLVEGESC